MPPLADRPSRPRRSLERSERGVAPAVSPRRAASSRCPSGGLAARTGGSRPERGPSLQERCTAACSLNTTPLGQTATVYVDFEGGSRGNSPAVLESSESVTVNGSVKMSPHPTGMLRDEPRGDLDRSRAEALVRDTSACKCNRSPCRSLFGGRHPADSPRRRAAHRSRRSGEASHKLDASPLQAFARLCAGRMMRRPSFPGGVPERAAPR